MRSKFNMFPFCYILKDFTLGFAKMKIKREIDLVVLEKW